MVLLVAGLGAAVILGSGLPGSSAAGFRLAERHGPAIFRGHPAAGSRRPRVLLFSATPAMLPAAGGTVKLSALVAGASECRFGAAVRVGTLPAARRCGAGSASVTVRVEPNTGTAAATYSFTLKVYGKHGKLVAPHAVVQVAGLAVTPKPDTTTAPGSSTGASPAASAPPHVTSSPTDFSTPFGTTATFNAAASGNPVPGVQWQVSSDGGSVWSDVAGATAATYSFTAATDGNRYRAVFTNSAGNATSTAATLTVTGSPVAPSVSADPSDTTVTAGTVASFTAAATGSPTPTVQWQVSTNGGSVWTDVAGATADTLSFNATAAQNGREYEAVFSNDAGPGGTKASATTAPATLTVNTAPQVTTEPQADIVISGNSASFTAHAAGSPSPSVQWQLSTDGGSTWSAVSGATADTLSFTTSAGQTGNLYHALFTNAAGSATSAAATLTVETAPQVSSQPANATVTVGGTATFAASASGLPAPTVHWEFSSNGGTSWGAVAGATSATYSFPTLEAENGYEYRAVFANVLGSITTNAATLTLKDQTTTNWSGYVVSGATFTAVTGSWIVPSVNCTSHAHDYYSAQWIGIDGDSSQTVEQDGTEADCFGTTAVYGAWYEMYGDNAIAGGNEVPLGYTVQPGDAISASVSVASNEWTLTIADSTQSWSYSTPQIPFTAAQSSAEWIGERPYVCYPCGLASLANFGSFRFTGASATTAGGAPTPTTGFPSYTPLDMVGSAKLAAPGPIDPTTGAAFTDYWYGSS